MKASLKGFWICVALTCALAIGAGVMREFSPAPVFAQNAGTTGTFTVSQKAVYTAGVSQIFNNVGQSAHWLSYCSSGGNFTGTVDIEESYDGATNWIPIAFSSYIATPLSGCAILQAGGYYQNIRSVMTASINTIVATYNASSGPISFSPTGQSGIGATAPTVCNQSAQFPVNAGTTLQLFGGVSNSTIRVCSYIVSFGAAPSSGFIEFQSSTSPSSCTGLVAVWVIDIYAGTLPDLSQGSGVGALFSGTTGNSLCFTNTTTTNAYVSVALAPVYQTF